MFSGLTFHHYGLALRKDKDAIGFLKPLGYLIGDLVFDPLQNVNLRLCTHASMPAVEIVMPDAQGDSPITPILQRQSEMIYHICYETRDLAKTLQELDAAGLRCLCVSEPKPAILFGGRRVSFYQIVGFGLIELLETG